MSWKRCRIWVLIIMGVLFVSSCDHHFYKPLKGEFYHPFEFNLAFEPITFQSEDGETLHGWFIPAVGQPAKGTILHLHGNSANMTSYLFYISFLAKAGYHLMMFDYRGYGDSSGEPTAEGLLLDSKAAFEYVKQRKEIGKGPIIIYGQSLGGAVALTLLDRIDKKRVTAVISEAAFASYRLLAQKKMEDITILKWFSGIAASLSIDDDLSPLRFIDTVSPVPLLIVHGTDDRVVPFDHGQQLFNTAREPKTFWVIEGGRHIQMLSKFRSIYRSRLLDYISNLPDRE